MGFFDRFGDRREKRRAKAARAKELAGELAAAVELYLEAGQPDEASRVLLLRADAERSPEKRMAFCALAAQTATGEAAKKAALGRKARLAFDILRTKGGSFLQSELSAVARELEQAGELERAADAHALAGDTEAEVRALTAAGAIERLEERLRIEDAAARDSRERGATLRRITDLDRTAERRAALELARAWLASHEDERVANAVRTIRAKLARGPLVELDRGGRTERFALGDEVTVGRGDATIVVASRAISRRHIALRRRPEGALVTDLDTRNGTTLAGARLGAPIPVGAGLEVVLGGEIPCSITPVGSASGADGGAFAYEISVGGQRYLAPLGEAEVGPFRVGWEVVGEDSFVVLHTPAGRARPFLDGYELAARVELCRGDEIHQQRGGPLLFSVVG